MENEASKVAVCVMAKQPRPGEVKTRLIPSIGPAGAAMLAQGFLDDAIHSVSSLKWARPVLAITDTAVVYANCEVWEQSVGDLGARQENVLRRALRDSSAAVLIGTDCPGLPVSILENARLALVKFDAVVGPSHDGGFYLIGLKRCPERLLSEIRWSQPDTFQQTLSRLQSFGMTVAILDSWSDVDTPQELTQLIVNIASLKIHAPHTEIALGHILRTHRRFSAIPCASSQP